MHLRCAALNARWTVSLRGATIRPRSDLIESHSLARQNGVADLSLLSNIDPLFMPWPFYCTKEPSRSIMSSLCYAGVFIPEWGLWVYVGLIQYKIIVYQHLKFIYLNSYISHVLPSCIIIISIYVTIISSNISQTGIITKCPALSYFIGTVHLHTSNMKCN